MEQTGAAATSIKYLQQQSNEGAIRLVRGTLKPQPSLPLWVRLASPKNTGRTDTSNENLSTACLASVLMVGQNPISPIQSTTYIYMENSRLSSGMTVL